MSQARSCVDKQMQRFDLLTFDRRVESISSEKVARVYTKFNDNILGTFYMIEKV